MTDPRRTDGRGRTSGPARGGSLERIREATRLLEARGLAGVRVDAVGHRGEIAAVTAPVDRLDRLVDAVAEIKALGFEYVTLDLAAGRSRDGSDPVMRARTPPARHRRSQRKEAR